MKMNPISIPVEVEGLPLTFAEVSEINARRCDVWHAEMDEWSAADWSNAVAGEAGELAEQIELLILALAIEKKLGLVANMVKKIRRQETGTIGAVDADIETIKDQVAAEGADVYFYLDLLFRKIERDMPTALAAKFNAISDREATKRPEFAEFKINYPRRVDIPVDIAIDEGDVS